MGGSGSGNHYHWWRRDKKTPVEDCKNLDVREFARMGFLTAGYYGSVRWRRGEQQTGSIDYHVRGAGAALCLVLTYRVSPPGEDVELPIPLETTRPQFGGVRWWARCPLVVNGTPCGRRVAKLYLPPSAHYFGCRHCHGLTYTSCQEHDKRVTALRRNPELLEALLADPSAASSGQLILALKAFRPRRW